MWVIVRLCFEEVNSSLGQGPNGQPLLSKTKDHMGSTFTPANAEQHLFVFHVFGNCFECNNVGGHILRHNSGTDGAYIGTSQRE